MDRKTGRGISGLLTAVTGALIMCVLICVAAFANGEESLVSWTPQRQAEAGKRTVELTVNDPEDGKFALVDIPLPEGVGVAADGEGKLTPTDLDSAELPEGGGLVLVKNDDGSQVLRVVAVGDDDGNPTTYGLTFSTEGGDKAIPPSEAQVLAQNFTGLDELNKAFSSLLSVREGASTVSLTPFTVYDTVPAELVVSGDLEPIDLGTQDAKATYTISIQKHAGSDGSEFESRDYKLSLTLPEELSLPEGELTYENGAITCGTVEIVRLALPEVEGSFEVSGLTRTNDDLDGLEFTLSVPCEQPEPVDPEYYNVSMSVSLANLIRVPEAFEDVEMTLSVAPGAESTANPVSSTVKVTASAASKPGDGGWTIVATDWEDVTQRVFWSDNNSSSRPHWEWGEGKLHPHLYFTIDGVEYELTEDTMGIVGLTAMPKLEQTSVSTTLTVSGLPTKIKQTSADQDGETFDVSWRIAPPSTAPSDYTFLNLTKADVGEDHNYSSVDTPGWYFVLQDTFTFRVEVKQGDNQALVTDVVRELMKFFDFNWSYGANKTGSDNILSMIEDHTVEATFNPDTHTVTIKGLWAYNVDGSPITYKVVEAGTSPDGAITKEELGEITNFPNEVLEDSDRYAVQYDNTGVSNYGNETDAVYSGGMLRLVRQGETSYTATKIWLDPYAQNDEKANRPTATYTLYRYREGQEVSTAAAVQGVTAKLVWVEASTASGEDAHWEVQAVDSDGNMVQLEKYDPMDGHRWIYVTKETLSGENAGQYQQVFGRVDTSGADGTLGEVISGTDKGPEDDWKRQDGDTYLYNGGTLTNRMEDSVLVPVTKIWNAASFQSTFEDSAVALTLQYRVKDAGDDNPGSWQNYTGSDGKEWVRYLTGFSAVHLTRSLEGVPAMPRYLITSDGRTQEVEYRWIETAVYEDAPNATETELGQDASESPYEVKGYTDDPNEGSFEVTGTTRTYRVEVETSSIDSNDEDGPLATTITNTLEDTLDYEVIKEWKSGTIPDEITIQIYQAVTGEDFNYNEPYLTFTMDESSVSPEKFSTGETLISSVDGWTDPEGDSEYWQATVKDLPRYDDEGRAYEYLLLEQGQFPIYKTEIQEDGDYRTTVINGTGEGGFSFMVRKVWKDDSDIQHRTPVTFTVYNKHTNQPIKINDGSTYTITIGDDGVWHQVVWANSNDWTTESKAQMDDDDDINADDIYVVETSIKKSNEPNDSENVDVIYGENSRNYDSLYGEDGSGGDECGDVTTNNHRYEVTYKSEDSGTNESMRAFTVTNRRLGNVDITAIKTWVDGRRTSNQDGTESGKTLSEQIAKLVQEIKEEGGKNLALVFELDFESVEPGSTWNITRTGGLYDHDNVQVGGDTTDIYKSYTGGTTDPGSDLEAENAAWRTYGDYGSSQQIIIGLGGDGDTVVSDSSYFYGLPKYDSEGKVVNYVVNEKWVEITTDSDGKETTDDADLDNLVNSASEGKLKDLYTQLNNLWSDYVTTSTSTYEENIANAAHTRDFQEVKLTNTRSDTKTITWTKDWEDYFTHSNNQRPDLYLDIYRVAHYEEGDDYVCKIEKYMSTGDWVADESDSSKLKITLNVPEFDNNGIEYVYYAVERTVMSAGDYDYAAGKYSIEGKNGTVEQLGTRDKPSETAHVLNTAAPEDGISNFNVLDLDAQGEGAIGWENKNDKPGNIGSFGSENDYPRYALIEGGTFTNSLENTYKIEGIKYWTNLPSGWEDARLPSVTFKVYRTVGGEEPSYEANSEVATLTVKSEAWEKIRQGNGFAYSIEYGGNSTLKVEDGEAKYVYAEGASELPRYDEQGRLYTYYVTEEADLTSTAAGQQDAVFTTSSTGSSFTNAYEPDKGTIKVKKFLYLPMENDGTPEAYPAVTFELTRQVKDASGAYGNDTAFAKVTHTISSEEVQTEWNQLVEGGKNGDYVTLTADFEELPLYAPDGSEYRYTVTEVKTELNGYNTWAEKGDVTNPEHMNTEGDSVGELEPVSDGAVVATFKNQQPTQPLLFEQFTGTKKWNDFDNRFGFRPTQADYKALLTLMRSAESQTGQNNAIPSEEVLCEITWTTVENSDTWSFTIKPVKEGAFEKYAPNGMPWRYELSEPLVEETGKLQLDAFDSDAESNEVYLPSTSNGAWPTTIVDSLQQPSMDFGTLTNSTSGKAWFEKKWVDSNNQEIAEDYLGFELSVTFKLQVSTDGGNTWGDAKDNSYVTNVVDENDLEKTVCAFVDDENAWMGSFDNLPTIAKDGSGSNVYLTYRVVETSVKYGSGLTSQSINIGADGAYTVESGGLVTSATFSKSNNTSTTTNKLSTISVSVTKVWSDGSNQYGTRPGASGPSTWSAWFVLQRSSDGGDAWENVAVFDKLFGQNQNSIDDSPTYGTWTATIDGLPTTDYNGTESKNYTYRVRELQPKEDGYSDVSPADISEESIVQEGGSFNSAGSSYETKYSSEGDAWTVTNSLDLYTPDPGSSLTDLKAVKDWVGEDKNGSVSSVTFQLQYREDGSNEEWEVVPFGSAEQTANAANSWTVSWDGLPSTYDGKTVEYCIVENAGSGWVQLAEPEGAADGGTYTYTFKNSVTRDYEVQKVWNPDSATPSEGVAVTVGLFRTTDSDNIGSISGQPVPVSETQMGSQQRTAQLDATGSWKATFTGLPKYDANGSTYYYYALEMSGDNPVSQPGTVEVDDKNYSVTYDFDKPQSGLFSGLLDLFSGNGAYSKTTITNTLTTELQGTKEWLDNSNAYGTRPNEITLALWRTTVAMPTDSDWTRVDLGTEGIQLEWSGKDDGDNSWTFTYTNLPAVDAHGDSYAYRVTEAEPAGYEAKYDHTKHEITNTLTGTVTINGTKVWVGGNAGNEPALTLERRLVGSEGESGWQNVDNATATWNDDLTTFTFSNLDKYDSEGRLYEYRVRETVPDGYEASYATGTATDATTNAMTNDAGKTSVNGAVITNYKDGDLEIEKVVSGNRGERDREFTFTVTLTGTSSAGTLVSDLNNETFSYTITNSDGTQASTGSLRFTSDPADSTRVVSDEFKLSHGQTIKIEGLPAGIGYEVTELEAGENGYFTSSVGATGSVPAGATAQVEYRNYRHVDETVTVSGTKTWVDDADALGLRPDEIELRLYCSVAGGEEWIVEGVSPVWNKQGDVWSYSYVGLPKYDDDHNEYVYRVEEVVPEGYVGTSQGNDLTNTVIEHTDLTGTKTWVGDDPASRPESITVKLYANGIEVAIATATADNGWTYVFENMPRYDADGNEIVYTVAETPVPDGYVATYDGLNVTNTSSQLVGSLRVTKLVRGPEAETDRDFTFTVTLGDAGINGTYGDMTFVNGVATFTLRHGQSAVAVGLPAGLSYVVRETPTEGYTLSATGQQGEIPVDSEATATFTNTKGEDPEDPLDPGDPGEPDRPADPGEPGGGIPFSGEAVLPVVLVALVGLATLIVSRFLRKSTK